MLHVIVLLQHALLHFTFESILVIKLMSMYIQGCLKSGLGGYHGSCSDGCLESNLGIE